ncbi:MAG TPA: hypothetical protein VLX92_30840 [Kofleriaceae bacterium]|nr:hypothetical protein [Kofleriaceae bacterium]
MPRIAIACAVLAACSFDANYRGGRYACSDGVCPTGYTCSAAKQCVTGGDAGAVDATIDAPPHALTCADPAPFPAAGGATSGTTVGRNNTITAMCDGFVMNGPDAVYRVDTAAGAQLEVSLTASYAAAAYVISPCQTEPATPACEGNMLAEPASPLALAPAAGTHYVIVDGTDAALDGTYVLTVTVH